ncbi:hypothetical protein CYY_010205, partial [Polysphondylium violaceum]
LQTLNIYSYSQNKYNCIITGSDNDNILLNYEQGGLNRQTLNVANITFSKAYYIVSALVPVSTSFTNCVFTNTQSDYYSVLMLVVTKPIYPYPTFNLTNCKFSGVTSNGAIMVDLTHYQIMIQEATVSGFNGANCFYFSSCNAEMHSLTINNSTTSGAPIGTLSSNITLTDGLFNNNVGNLAGVISTYESETPFSTTIIYSYFTNNTTPDNGGAIVLAQTSGQNTISSTFFISNTVTANRGRGGAIYIDGSNANITSCTFTSNSASNGGQGGAIYIGSGSTVSIANSKMNNNLATLGAAIFTNSSRLSFSSDTFSNNNASVGGSDVYCSSSSIDFGNSSLTAPNSTAYACGACNFINGPSNFQCGGSSSSNESPKKHNDLNDKDKKIIIAVVCGGVGLIAILIFIIIVYKRHHRRHHHHHHHHHHESSPLVYHH